MNTAWSTVALKCKQYNVFLFLFYSYKCSKKIFHDIHAELIFDGWFIIFNNEIKV
jgi:hypothetical protein